LGYNDIWNPLSLIFPTTVLAEKTMAPPEIIKPQKAEPSDPPNSRPFGTSGMSPADPLRGQETCQKQAAAGDRGR